MCILFCRPTQRRKHFQEVSSWYLIFLLRPTALNENITCQLRLSSLEDDSQHHHIEVHKLPGICVYFEMKARHVSSQAWK